MASGKTIDFATNVLLYMASGQALPAHDSIDGGLYVALLNGIPADAETGGGPYAGSDISSFEVSTGYRTFLSNNTLVTTGIDTTNDAVTISNEAGLEVTFPVAPASFNVSGYALCYTQANKTSGDYLAYEFFTGADASKRRSVNIGDTIKINVNGLTIREK